jgi:DNA polymerase
MREYPASPPLANSRVFEDNYTMTVEQKTHLASFLDLTADSLRGGYTREREPYAFSAPEPPAAAVSAARPLLMLIGEAKLSPGAVQLLDKMLASIGLFRGKNCVSGTEGQIGTLGPRFILCLGKAQAGDLPRIDGVAIPMLATYHPEELLRDVSLKRPAWEDLKTLRAKLMELDQDYARTVSSVLPMDGR